MTSCQVENDRPESETDGACTGTTSAPVARTGVKIMTPGAAGLRLGAGPAMGEMTPRGDGATGTGAVTTVGVMLTVGVNTTSDPTPGPAADGTSAWAAGSRVVPSRHIAAARLIARANPSCLGFIALPSQPYCSTAPQRTTSGPPADLSRRGDPALGFGTDRFQRPDRVRNHRGHQRTA